MTFDPFWFCLGLFFAAILLGVVSKRRRERQERAQAMILQLMEEKNWRASEDEIRDIIAKARRA
jgi:cbb3-type cytochrome oxidase subunit 3